MVPKVLYDTFSSHRYQSMQNSWIHQLSLPFRWIIPILVHHHPYFSFVNSWPVDFLISCCTPNDGILSELFCRALETCTRDSSTYSPSLRLLRYLPLDSMLFTMTPDLTSIINMNPKDRKHPLIMADAFFMSPLTHLLTRKPSYLILRHRDTILTVFRILDNQQLPLQFSFLKHYSRPRRHQRRPTTPSSSTRNQSSDNPKNLVVSSFIIFPKPFQLVSSSRFRSTLLPSSLTKKPFHSFIIKPLDPSLQSKSIIPRISQRPNNLYFHSTQSKPLHYKQTTSSLPYIIPKSISSPHRHSVPYTSSTVANSSSSHSIDKCDPSKMTLWQDLWSKLFLYNPFAFNIQHVIRSFQFPFNPSTY